VTGDEDVILVPKTRLRPDTRHHFVIDEDALAGQVQLDVFPDEGMARLRVHGDIAPAVWRRCVRIPLWAARSLSCLASRGGSDGGQPTRFAAETETVTSPAGSTPMARASLRYCRPSSARPRRSSVRASASCAQPFAGSSSINRRKVSSARPS
jgi:hypothetical protein